MPEGHAEIKCVKCGLKPHILGDVCPECGSFLVKVCGNCGFHNSVPKNYCDSCGRLLKLPAPETSVKPPPEGQKAAAAEPVPPPPSPPSAANPAGGGQVYAPATQKKLVFESLEDTVMPPKGYMSPGFKTAVKKTAQPAAAVSTAQSPSTAKAEKNATQPVAASLQLKPPAPKSAPEPAPKRKRPVLRIMTEVLVVLLVASSAAFILFADQLPRIMLIHSAKKYLGFLSRSDYAGAYEMLSAESKADCSLSEFSKLYNERYPNGSKGLNPVPVLIDRKGAIVRYDLQDGTGAWTKDTITFKKEDGKWVRPYSWSQVRRIEGALTLNDSQQALFWATKLQAADPMNPTPYGYLCGIEARMGLDKEAVADCASALEMSRYYPVGYSLETLVGFSFKLAAGHKRLNRFQEALSEFDKILSLDGVTAQIRCESLLERAGIFTGMKNYDAAVQDAMEAQNVCPPGRKKDANKVLRELTRQDRK